MAKYTLEVDTGLIEVELKDVTGKVLGSFEFSPTDSDIVNRYKDVVKAFNEVKAPEGLLNGEATDEETDAFQIGFSDMVREQLDYLLGHKVSDSIFGMCGPLTLLENGEFYYEHVVEGIGNLIAQVVEERIDEKLEKVKSATAKYENE